MKFTVRLNENDFFKFNEYYMKHSSQGKKSTLTARFLLPAVFLLVMVICFIANTGMLVILLEAVIFTITSIVWVLKVPSMISGNIRKSIEAVKKDGKLPFHETAEFEFTETEIVETATGSVKNVKYADIISVDPTDEYIYIFYGALQAFIIPRSCIGNLDLEGFLQSKTNWYNESSRPPVRPQIRRQKRRRQNVGIR